MTTAAETIKTVTRIATDVYDARDEDGHPRKLETFEALFLSAVTAINRIAAKEIADGLRTWGHGAAYQALCNLTERSQALKLEAAHAAYECERDRFNGDYDDSIEEVALQMAAE